MSNEPVIEYVINAKDEIAFVGQSWDPFAVANDGTSLASDSVLGRSLWDFITDAPTRHLYQQIITRVREGKPTRFTLRCDGPSCRRLLEMAISARPEGAVEFQTRVLRVEYREPVALLALSTARSAEVLKLCAWCNRINAGSDVNLWLEVEEATERLRLFERDHMPQLTHGICEVCLDVMMRTLATAE